ncbi:MAG: Fic family protein [Ruminococcus sp.]
MDILKFNKIINDNSFFNLKKLKYKYSGDFDEFMSVLKTLYYKELPLNDFAGNSLVYLDSFAQINMNAFKTLIYPQSNSYGERAVENEIISTGKIENIDYNRESVRNILKGFAPKDDEENRIFGLKKGFDFIADRDNTITQENIYKLYMMAVGDFLDDADKLIDGNRYRHDSVFVVGADLEHSGMPYLKLNSAMKALVEFINCDDNINDLAKATIIHFYIAYIHPYFDGNGRMARLLHLWFLVQKGYETALFIPFSSYIARSKNQYYNAYSAIEENYKISGVIDVSPFIKYFSDNVYNKLQNEEFKTDIFENYDKQLEAGNVTEKEKQLWNFVISRYGKGEFSTKQLEKDFGNAAYATIRSFVMKFEKLNLFTSQRYGNRVKYRIV